MDLWPHQPIACDAVEEAFSSGKTRVCLMMPTGAGKTATAIEILKQWLARDKSAIFYSSRKSLTAQTEAKFKEAGLRFGMRAAGFERDLLLPLQIGSLQTENARDIPPHFADLVIIDELHMCGGETAKKLVDIHMKDGACLLGLTATPIDVYPMAEHLIIGASVRELQRQGILVPAMHYGPDEPDMQSLDICDDISEKTAKKLFAFQSSNLFGRVLEWYNKLNKHRKPCILFAPGTEEGVWFAQLFARNGVNSAHIDGDVVWTPGSGFVPSTPEARQEVIDGLKYGLYKIVTNRFVLREGIDVPEVEHIILATVCSQTGTYLQAVGRGMRSCLWTNKKQLIVQDHGCNWGRHGSVNADREWVLSESDRVIRAKRADYHQNNPDKEPSRCGACGQIITRRKCMCGWERPPGKPSRPVFMKDGTLKLITGDIFPARIRRSFKNTAQLWQKCYWRSLRSKTHMTFRQAEGLFFYENRYWCPRDLKYMPRESADWVRPVSEVPRDRLI